MLVRPTAKVSSSAKTKIQEGVGFEKISPHPNVLKTLPSTSGFALNRLMDLKQSLEPELAVAQALQTTEELTILSFRLLWQFAKSYAVLGAIVSALSSQPQVDVKFGCAQRALEAACH